MSSTARRDLQGSLGLPQAVALYVGAVLGAGVLILPATSATEAGPASLVAWLVVGGLGVPIATTFATLAAGARLLDGAGRLAAAVGALLCAVLPFAGIALLFPLMAIGLCVAARAAFPPVRAPGAR